MNEMPDKHSGARQGSPGEEVAVRASVRSLSRPDAEGGERQGRARALLIYLKHRGVLNVEEFRRANPAPEGQLLMTPAADAIIRIGGD